MALYGLESDFLVPVMFMSQFASDPENARLKTRAWGREGQPEPLALNMSDRGGSVSEGTAPSFAARSVSEG